MLIQVVDVAAVWPWVREGLQKIVAKTNDDWLPEDVYHELKLGASTLYLIYHDDERLGFVVLQKWDKYHAGARLFIRALWGRGLSPHKQEIYAALQALARQHGCVSLRMTSTRRWELDGWTPKQTIYEMEV